MSDLADAARMATEGPEVDETDGGDLFEDVRQLRARLIKDGERLNLPVSSWPDGCLVISFGVLEPDEVLETYAADAGLDRNAALLARACRGVYLRNDRRQYVRLYHEGSPVGLDQLFAEKLHLPDDTGVTKLVLHLYGDNELAIGEDVQAVQAWMADTNRKIDGAVVGEFVDGPQSSAPREPSDTAPSASVSTT